jgi:hypothetical protein
MMLLNKRRWRLDSTENVAGRKEVMPKRKEPRSEERGSESNCRIRPAKNAATTLQYVMSLTKYHSVRASNSRRKKKKDAISQLAQDSFEAFKPFINVFDCGFKGDNGIFHLISKEDWRLHRRWKSGERGIRYPDGSKFNPYLHVVRNIYSAEHAHRHIDHREISYYTSGRNGLGLLYLDVDAHHEWQTDEYRAKEILKELFPAYFRASNRGQNGFLKVRYTSVHKFNQVADYLESTLERLFLHLGILCDIEIKGTATDKGKSGRLAKLPFTTKYPCNMRDETDSWNYPQLELFKSCPILNIRRVEQIARRLEVRIDEEAVRQFSEYKKSLKETKKEDNDLSVCVETGGKQILRGDHPRFGRAAFFPQGGRRSKVDDDVCSGKGGLCQTVPDEEGCTEGRERGHTDPSQTRKGCTRRVVDRPVHRRTCPSSVGALPDSVGSKEVRMTDVSLCQSGDAFIRNHEDIPPFLRAFYREHRRLPSTEETLNWLRVNGCYSGEWEENEGRRANRVRQILRFKERTFDPAKLSNGSSPPISLKLGKFSWWVYRHFGSSGITAKLTDLRRFDPMSMTAPSVTARVPAKFIETFMVVADVCLNQDPLENKAVPTTRIKKLWGMVCGGAPWNQRYFQIVRDRLDRMGVIRIFDRKHSTGKAWKWEAGSFPLGSFKEAQRKLKRKGLGLTLSFELENTFEKNNKVHNTLYETGGQILGSWTRQPVVRPPP